MTRSTKQLGGGTSLSVRRGSRLRKVAVLCLLTCLLAAPVIWFISHGRAAANRAMCTGNARQLALYLLSYHKEKGHFPSPVIRDQNGLAMHSWRTELFRVVAPSEVQGYSFDEPWDSEHNKKLIPLMPSVFQNPNLPSGDFKTNYLAVSGKGTLFDGQEKISVAAIRDGTTNTLMLVEANADRAVI